MSTSIAPTLKTGMRELAAGSLSAAEEYLSVIADVRGDDPAAFADARRRAYSLTLVLAQFNCALLELAPQIGELEQELRPPAGVILVLAALAGACALIAGAETQAKLRDVVLPSAERMEKVLTAAETQAWIRRCLALPST